MAKRTHILATFTDRKGFRRSERISFPPPPYFRFINLTQTRFEMMPTDAPPKITKTQYAEFRLTDVDEYCAHYEEV